uniref:Uncharacterized protein n=1 Tax=viral metagenome TaxID=1070528 RepID=A0A6M3JLT6_9ZZZZ
MRERRRHMTDICHYCGIEYHPMPHYARVVDEMTEHICVCHGYLDIEGEGWVPTTTCRGRAEADGYRFRRDLTPTR